MLNKANQILIKPRKLIRTTLEMFLRRFICNRTQQTIGLADNVLDWLCLI